jgi:hypothetical protein
LPLSSRLAGRDVLVQAEDVSRVVAGLDRREALPGLSRVGDSDALRALVAEEADVVGGRQEARPFRSFVASIRN